MRVEVHGTRKKYEKDHDPRLTPFPSLEIVAVFQAQRMHLVAINS